MSERIRVFVNERPLDLPAGADALTAAVAFDPAVKARLDADTAHLTDGRGILLAVDAPLASGSILRIVRSGRRGAPDADADP